MIDGLVGFVDGRISDGMVEFVGWYLFVILCMDVFVFGVCVGAKKCV